MATETNCGNIVKSHTNMITMKICSQCNEEKSSEMFGFKSKPKMCTPCAEKWYKQEYQRNREKHLQNRAAYYEKNKEAILATAKSFESKQKRNARLRERRQTDVAFRIVESLKIRIVEVVREHKVDSSSKHIGCTKGFLMEWIESQFDDKMTWENYAIYWHIDHVIPVSFFDITSRSEQLICFNWTNLRPLEKRKNISKFNKIVEDDILLHCQILIDFIDDHTEYQEHFEKSVWSRFQLEYGNNNGNDEEFKTFLKSIIRIEASKAD